MTEGKYECDDCEEEFYPEELYIVEYSNEKLILCNACNETRYKAVKRADNEIKIREILEARE